MKPRCLGKPNFDGASAMLAVGRHNMADLGIPNDTMSSLKIPSGTAVTLYENKDWQGASKTCVGDVPSLGDFDNKVSSLEVFPAVVVFDRPNYQGNAQTFAFGHFDRSAISLSEYTISSVQVPLGMMAVLYDQPGLKGMCRCALADIPHLLAYDNKTSSLKVSRPVVATGKTLTSFTEGPSDATRNLWVGKFNVNNLWFSQEKPGLALLSALTVPEGVVVTLYEEEYLKGTSRRYDASTIGSAKLGTSSCQVRSLEVAEVVTVYEHKNYGGRRQMLGLGNYDRANLTFGHDKISSVRVPPELEVRLFRDTRLRGSSVRLTQDSPKLAGFNDQTSSLSVTGRYGVHIYGLSSVGSGKSADVDKRSSEKGARIKQLTWHGGASQQGRVLSVDDGSWFKVVSCQSGMVLAVGGASKDAGANVIQWPWWGGHEQQWRVVPVGEVTFKLINRNSGMVLAVTSPTDGDGSRLTQQPWDGDDDQRWTITALNSVDADGNPCGAEVCAVDLCARAACGAAAQGVAVCGGAACGADACGVDACGGAVCGLAAIGVGACGAEACGIDVCGGAVCVMALTGVSLCGAAACGAAVGLASLCGADACGADVCGGDACGAEACGADVAVVGCCGADACGAAACVAATCGLAACGADACGADACGVAVNPTGVCGVAACPVDTCPVDVCGANVCGLNLCPLDACSADACGVDVIPLIPGI